MNNENKSSDEILNELYNSLNLPTSPFAVKKETKSDCNTESSDDSDTDASSINNNLSKEIKPLIPIEKSSNKHFKKKDKKRKKKLKKESKSKHKKKRKRKEDIVIEDFERKSSNLDNLSTSDLTVICEKSANDILDKVFVNNSNHKSSKDQELRKKRSLSRSHSRNRENHSKSKSKPRYSRSRSRSKTKSYSRSRKISHIRHYRTYSRLHSQSPSKNCKRMSNPNRSLSHSLSPSPYKINKHIKSRSRSPIKKELSDPLDIWRMAKLASLKRKHYLAGLSDLESIKPQQNASKNVTAATLETCSGNLLPETIDIEPPLETIPLPGPSTIETKSVVSSEKWTELCKQKNQSEIIEIDLTCIPFPVVEECTTVNTSCIPVSVDNNNKDLLKNNENISKIKEEGKGKIIVIKSLKDSLVFQQAEEAQIKKEKSGGEEIELGLPANMSVTSNDDAVLKNSLVANIDETFASQAVDKNAIEAIHEEYEKDSNKNEQKLISSDCEPINEFETENKVTAKANEPKEREHDIEKKYRKKSRSRSRTRGKSRSRSINKSSHSNSKKRSHSRKRKKSRSKSRSRSWSYSRSKSKKSSHKHSQRSRSRSRKRRKSSRSRSRSYSHSKSSYRKKSSYSRENSHRKKSPDCVDSLRDKATRKRLLEVARRNAVYLMKNNCLPPSIEKESVKATGKSVEELTSFCKQLVAKEEFSDQELSDPSLSPDEDTDAQHDKPFGASRHPFAIKDSKPILMNIRNAPMLPTKTNAERLADTSKLREQFPVSSGSQHRNKEGWVTVEKDEKVKEETVFPEVPKAEVDISSLVSTRLSAMRRLQDNPQDRDAIKALNTAQKDMQDWALSKQAPGQFTGSTGVRILSQEELASGFQAWARKNYSIFNCKADDNEQRLFKQETHLG